MNLTRIKLNEFRNYDEIQLSFSAGINCITGLNGSGKTNLLNGIFYLCLGKGFTTGSDQQAIKKGADFFRISGEFAHANGLDLIVCTYKQGSKKELLKNEVPYLKFSDHVGQYPAVVVCPDDQILIDGLSEERRRYMDLTISQTEPVYLKVLINYNRLLEQRNAYLKRIAEEGKIDFDYLNTLNQQMSSEADIVYQYRKQAMSVLNQSINEIYEMLAGRDEKIELTYESCLNENKLENLLQKVQERDFILQRTTEGIHRDDLSILLNGLSAKKFGSQGQKKTILLAMKLAQHQFIKKQTQRNPLLLLDDIFDKLDEERMHRLIEIISKEPFGQVFITDTGRLRWHAFANPELPVNFIAIGD